MMTPYVNDDGSEYCTRYVKSLRKKEFVHLIFFFEFWNPFLPFKYSRFYLQDPTHIFIRNIYESNVDHFQALNFYQIFIGEESKSYRVFLAFLFHFAEMATEIARQKKGLKRHSFLR